MLGWLLISASLPRLPAALTSLLLTIQPVASVALGALLFAEAPSALQLVGVATILAGLVMVARVRPPPMEGISRRGAVARGARGRAGGVPAKGSTPRASARSSQHSRERSALTSSSAPSRSTKASSDRRRPSTARSPTSARSSASMAADSSAARRRTRRPLALSRRRVRRRSSGSRAAQQVAALDHLVGQLARRLAADAQQLGQPRHGRLLGVDGADDEAEGGPRIARARLAHRGREAVAEAAVGGHEDDGQIRFVNHGRLSTIVA